MECGKRNFADLEASEYLGSKQKVLKIVLPINDSYDRYCESNLTNPSPLNAAELNFDDNVNIRPLLFNFKAASSSPFSNNPSIFQYTPQNTSSDNCFKSSSQSKKSNNPFSTGVVYNPFISYVEPSKINCFVNMEPSKFFKIIMLHKRILKKWRINFQSRKLQNI